MYLTQYAYVIKMLYKIKVMIMRLGPDAVIHGPGLWDDDWVLKNLSTVDWSSPVNPSQSQPKEPSLL